MKISSNGVIVRDVSEVLRTSISGVSDTALREIKERIDEIGYVVVSNVLDPNLVLDIRLKYFEMFPKGCDRNGSVTTKEGFEILMKDYGKITHPSKVIQQSSEYQLLIRSLNLQYIAQYLAQSNVRLVKYLVLRNYGKFSKSSTMAHFDEVYVSNPPEQMINFWIPLGRVSIETGTLAYLPRSHRLNVYRLKDAYHKYCGIRPKGGYPFGDNLDEISDYLGLSSWECVELDPGSVVIHHPLVLHSGTDSISEYCRLSTDVRFVPEEWYGDERWDESWCMDSMKKWPSL